MKIDIRSSMLPISAELELHITRRIDIALRRFAHEVERVLLRLADLSASEGAREKRCRIAARFAAPLPVINVEATDMDAFVAVSQAASRLEAALSSLRRQSS